MYELIFPALFLFFLAPITLAIIALVKISGLRTELRNLSRKMTKASEVSRDDQVRTSAPHKELLHLDHQAPVDKPEPTKPATPPSPPVSTQPTPATSSPVPTKPKVSMEFLMGGRAAAYAGIAVLVIGIAFLVGYAIQHSWIGPAARVILGLLSGGALVGVGHFVGLRNRKYEVFARVLTGGGSALFYFTVFSAYAFYHLIGVWVAGAGLAASALAVFGLAMVYRSQSVGVLGVLGAFITPLLIGADMDVGLFPMVYVALINVPVILLGTQRRWQILYNLSFVFTVILYVAWMSRMGNDQAWICISFALLFFLQFAALGLLKLRHEQTVLGRNIDLVRLVMASLLLMAAVYGLMNDAGMHLFVGGAFLFLALLHAAIAWFAYRTLSRFNGEILAFLAGGLAFATLALPAQLDGEWVSLGWAVEGAVLAWFAARVKSRVLQAGAFLLGMIGMMKGLVFDVTLYPSTPKLFLNARFASGVISAALLGVQGKMAGRFPEETGTKKYQDILWCAAVLGAVLVCFCDVFWTLGIDSGYSWLLSSLMLLATGAAVVLFAPCGSSVGRLGSVLLLAVPVKLLVIDAFIGLDWGGYGMVPFRNAIIWIELLMVAAILLLLIPRIDAKERSLILPEATFSTLLNIASLAAGIGVVSIEILRKPDDWADTAVTIFWAVCAFVLILFGMKKRIAARRYFGLVLFGLTTLKVLLVDSSELGGLERIIAFIGTGILLLALSFAYQKASTYFEEQKRGLK